MCSIYLERLGGPQLPLVCHALLAPYMVPNRPYSTTHHCHQHQPDQNVKNIFQEKVVTSGHYFLRKNNASHCLVGTFHQRALQATNSHSTAQSQFSIRYSGVADNCGHHSKMSPFSVFHRQQCCRTVHSAKVWWKFSHRSCVEYNCTSESLPLPRTDKLSLTALILSNNWPLSKQLQMSI